MQYTNETSAAEKPDRWPDPYQKQLVWQLMTERLTFSKSLKMIFVFLLALLRCACFPLLLCKLAFQKNKLEKKSEMTRTVGNSRPKNELLRFIYTLHLLYLRCNFFFFFLCRSSRKRYKKTSVSCCWSEWGVPVFGSWPSTWLGHDQVFDAGCSGNVCQCCFSYDVTWKRSQLTNPTKTDGCPSHPCGSWQSWGMPSNT